MPHLQDAPHARFMVVSPDNYEPAIVFFAQRESAQAYYDSTTGYGEGIYLVEILDEK